MIRTSGFRDPDFRCSWFGLLVFMIRTSGYVPDFKFLWSGLPVFDVPEMRFLMFRDRKWQILRTVKSTLNNDNELNYMFWRWKIIYKMWVKVTVIAFNAKKFFWKEKKMKTRTLADCVGVTDVTLCHVTSHIWRRFPSPFWCIFCSQRSHWCIT